MSLSKIQPETLAAAMSDNGQTTDGLASDKEQPSLVLSVERPTGASNPTAYHHHVSPVFVPPHEPVFPPASPLWGYDDEYPPIIQSVLVSEGGAQADRPSTLPSSKTYAEVVRNATATQDVVDRVGTNVTFGKRRGRLRLRVKVPKNDIDVIPASNFARSGIKLRINLKPGFERITVIGNDRDNAGVIDSIEHDDVQSNSDVVTTSKLAGTSRKRRAAQAVAEDSDVDEETVSRKKTALTAGTYSTKPLSVSTKKKGMVNVTKQSTRKQPSRKRKDRIDDSNIDEDNVPRKKTALTAGTHSNEPPSVPTKKDTVNVTKQPAMKRKDRIVDPDKPKDAALIAAATKAGTDIYDSDNDLANSELKGVKKRELFRNVYWGAAATDFTDDSAFPTDPEFNQFVPGRWERQSDGTVADQKRKLLVKFTDRNGDKRIFTNPPPADWTNQEAITILNKRTVQQIRRNTDTRFREVVVPYVLEERHWIVANLEYGKPTKSWAEFVVAFNNVFAGKTVDGLQKPRPARTLSSLCKEVERFGARYYSKGLVPKME